MRKVILKMEVSAGVDIMGAVTYNDMAAFWPNPSVQPPEHKPFAAPMSENLIDEYRLVTHPVALGGGSPLFKDLPASLNLKLRSATTFPSGVVAHIYER